MDDRPDLTSPDHPTDDDLAGLVRELAAGWTMPAGQVSASGWYERVRLDHSQAHRSRIDGLLGRLGRAALLAAATTAAVALVAVWLTLPRSPSAGVGTSPQPVATAPAVAASSPTTTPASPALQPPASTPSGPLPAYERVGAPVSPSGLLVSGGTGYEVLDLSTGTLGAPFLPFSDGPVTLGRRPNGALVALDAPTTTGSGTDGVAATVRLYDATGTPRSSFPVRTYLGRPDPAVRISGTNVVSASQGASADVSGTLSADGSRLYVGWTVRQPPAWQIGIDVVDLASGTMVQTIDLPSAPSSSAGVATYASAPTITVSPDGRHVVIVGTTVDRAGQAESERWSAPVTGGRIGTLTPFGSQPGSLGACAIVGDEGFATSTTYYGVCTLPNLSVVLRRVDLLGAAIGDTPLTSTIAATLNGLSGHVIDRRTASYYAWDPFGGLLVRLDLASGQVTGAVSIPKPAASVAGPLDLGSLGQTVGGWFAPRAAAKTYLQPSLALSPDGTWLYLLGTTATSPTDTAAGSTGIWVVDARTLATVGHWAATADFVSVAVSADGSFVYAAGMPGNDAAGSQTGQDGSVTVYGAADGQVRVIAGRLGQEYLDLSPTVP